MKENYKHDGRMREKEKKGRKKGEEMKKNERRMNNNKKTLFSYINNYFSLNHTY